MSVTTYPARPAAAPPRTATILVCAPPLSRQSRCSPMSQLDCSHSARPVAILFESLTPYRRGALAHLRLEVGSQRNAFARRALTSSSTRNSVQPISIQAIVADGRPAVCGSARRAQTYQMPRVRRGWAVGRASWPRGTHLRAGFGMLPTRQRGTEPTSDQPNLGSTASDCARSSCPAIPCYPWRALAQDPPNSGGGPNIDFWPP